MEFIKEVDKSIQTEQIISILILIKYIFDRNNQTKEPQ